MDLSIMLGNVCFVPRVYRRASELSTLAMTSNRSFECNAPDVVFEHFGDEIVLLNLQSGNYYSLDPIGMFYWEFLSQGVPSGEIAAHIRGFYTDKAGEGRIG